MSSKLRLLRSSFFYLRCCVHLNIRRNCTLIHFLSLLVVVYSLGILCSHMSVKFLQCKLTSFLFGVKNISNLSDISCMAFVFCALVKKKKDHFHLKIINNILLEGFVLICLHLIFFIGKHLYCVATFIILINQLTKFVGLCLASLLCFVGLLRILIPMPHF